MDDKPNDKGYTIYTSSNKKPIRSMSEIESVKHSYDKNLHNSFSEMQNTLQRQFFNQSESQITCKSLNDTAIYNQKIENDDQASIIEAFVIPDKLLTHPSKLMGEENSSQCCVKPLCDIF